jgi:molecular chaperone GrpE
MAHIESSEVPPNTVLQVLQSGFLIRDRMIRPARVVVAKAEEGQTAEEAPREEES